MCVCVGGWGAGKDFFVCALLGVGGEGGQGRIFLCVCVVGWGGGGGRVGFFVCALFVFYLVSLTWIIHNRYRVVGFVSLVWIPVLALLRFQN